MKNIFTICVLLLYVNCVSNAQKVACDFPKLTGPYLGQKPPGTTPEIFAPGIVSLENTHNFKGAFSPDGNEYYFCRHSLPQKPPTLLYTTLVEGKWTEIKELAIAKGAKTFHPLITSDNKWLLFRWQFESGSEKQSGYYASERTDTGWSTPKFAGEGFYLTSDNVGNLYTLEIERKEGAPKFYIVQAALNNGILEKHERVKIDKHYGLQTHPCIAPDGSYLIFDTETENSKIFVSFKDGKGDWSEPIDLTEHGFKPDMRGAYISPDGKYLFFGYNGDIRWVDIKIIENMRKDALKETK